MKKLQRKAQTRTTMKNSFMKEPERMRALAQLINSSDSILLFPHSKMDGDAAGSCGALCAALRNQGKQAYVFADEVIPDNLKFLVKDFVTEAIPKIVSLLMGSFFSSSR